MSAIVSHRRSSSNNQTPLARPGKWAQPRPDGDSLAKWAEYYAEAGLALAALRPGEKLPYRQDWHSGPIATVDAARKHWKATPTDNFGMVLGPSGVATFDVDHVDHARRAFDAAGLDLHGLLGDPKGVAIEGRPERQKRIYQLPCGLELTTKALEWSSPPGSENPSKGL